MATNTQLIYERWKASLKDKNRSFEFVASNFDELFDALNAAGTSFEDAHALLPAAIKAHQPALAIAKNIWKTVKSQPKNAELSEKEYIEQWNKDIADTATNSFYSIFSMPVDPDDDGEPKVFGSMSAKEYKLQRRHADSYPVLDTEELERRMQSGVYDPVEDFMNKDDSGESK